MNSTLLAFDDQIDRWGRDYKKTGEASTVEFRSFAVPPLSPDRYTHLLHPYPAKLLPHIPFLFLQSKLANPTSRPVLVADPFCGSGTVLLEAALLGCHAIGADTNPLARLIARVKLQPISPDSIRRTLSRLNSMLPQIRDTTPPPVVNIKKWYREETIAELAKLRVAIKTIKSREMRDFMQVCLSVCARKVSLADPRLSVPVRINLEKKCKYGPHFGELKRHLLDVTEVPALERFNDIVQRNAKRVASLQQALPEPPDVAFVEDALTLESANSHGKIDLIITSPPYVGAQKYIRASSLSLGWLDMAYAGQLRSFERKTIGREHFSNAEMTLTSNVDLPAAQSVLDLIEKVYPLRAHIARVYLFEIQCALRAMYNKLRPGGNLILITGPNTICGFRFSTPEFIEQLAARIGFSTRFKLVDHIRSRGLMTKRNKTASIISVESVLCMRKDS